MVVLDGIHKTVFVGANGSVQGTFCSQNSYYIPIVQIFSETTGCSAVGVPTLILDISSKGEPILKPEFPTIVDLVD